MSRLTTIEAQYSQEIRTAVEKFGDHEDVSHGQILRWIAQFSDQHLDLASKVLFRIRYYNASQIRVMTRELVRSVLETLDDIDRKKIYFVPVGAPGSSSNIIARVLRDLGKMGSTRGIKMAMMTDLEKLKPDEVSAIVFVDDFSGTGDQLRVWWETVEQLVLPKKADVVVGLLVMNGRARGRIEQFAKLAISIDELGEEANVLSNSSRHFDQKEKELLLQYCRKTACDDEYLKGRGECGLLVAFKHGCPNNSLPILWHEKHNKLHALFLRHAI